MAKYVIVDSCACPRKLAPVLEAAKKKVGVAVLYNSIYRGQDAAALLHRYGKHTQAELYQLYLEGKGAPANPPERSTHELRSDGVPYVGPIGRRLRWWQCGLDVNDALVPQAKAAFASLPKKRLRRQRILVSVPAFQPYPSGSEYHHLNLPKKPIQILPALKKGSKGRRVKSLTTKLALIHRPGKPGETYFSWGHRTKVFGRGVEKAVKQFQRDHHLTADGIVGAHTAAQLRVSWRHVKNSGDSKPKEGGHRGKARKK